MFFSIACRVGRLLEHPRDWLRIHLVGKVDCVDDFEGMIRMSKEDQLLRIQRGLSSQPYVNLRRVWVKAFEEGSILRIRKVNN